MANNLKKYASLTTLENLVDQIKTLFVKKEDFTKEKLGLDKVSNTSDMDKPVSTKQQAAIDTASDAALGSAKTYTDNKVSGLASSSSVTNAISTHNQSGEAHSDIRQSITGLTKQVNDFLDVDDETRDQLSEVLTLIDGNKGSLDELTKNKVSVSDIVNSLNSNESNKPLSAAQGTALKGLIDVLTDTLDSHASDTAKHITATERTNWNTAYTHSTQTHAPSDAQKNQNAFSNVKVGSTTIAADTATDTLELVGSNVTITPDATNDKVTISVADGSTSAKGIVQLIDSVSDTSTSTAATPNSVKSAYDLAKQAKDAADDIGVELDEIKAGYLPLEGGTVTGTTVFNKVQDAAADSYNAPAVVIGGDPTTYHLELDNNEIQAKQNETTAGNLFLNSNGGTVHVGFGGLKMDSESAIIPEYVNTGSIGTADLPFDKMYSRFYNLYGDANVEYGNFRLSTGTTSSQGLVTLELGNTKAKGTAHNASGRITMRGDGNSFTNILPNANRTSGSNSVYLPTSTGTLALEETSTKARTMTSAQYNALTTEEINANTLYMITDEEEEDYVDQTQLDELRAEIDASIANKAVVQFITWGEDDTYDDLNAGEVTD